MSTLQVIIIIIIIFLYYYFFIPGSKGSRGLKTKVKNKVLEWLLVRWIHGKRVMQKHWVKTLDRHRDTLE